MPNMFTVYEGTQPVKTFDNEVLAQHFANDLMIKKINGGCDCSIPEHTVKVTKSGEEK